MKTTHAKTIGVLVFDDVEELDLSGHSKFLAWQKNLARHVEDLLSAKSKKLFVARTGCGFRRKKSQQIWNDMVAIGESRARELPGQHDRSNSSEATICASGLLVRQSLSLVTDRLSL